MNLWMNLADNAQGYVSIVRRRYRSAILTLVIVRDFTAVSNRYETSLES